MFANSNNYSLSDIAAVTGANDGFGGGNSGWWLILLVLIFFGGWGGYGRGFGGFSGGTATESSSVYEGYVLNNDMSMLNKAVTDSYSMTERKLDGIANGLCDGFYTQAQLINGIDKSIANGTYTITNAITQDTIANMQNTNALASQLAQCCCDNRAATADVKYTIGSGFADANYNLATQANGISTAIANGFCQTNFNAQTNTRDIVDSQNAGTQAILARIDALESSRKDEKIAELTAKLNRADLAASQAAQNQYLVERLDPHPCPINAYVVQPPQQITFPTSCCGQFNNSGCGCNC